MNGISQVSNCETTKPDLLPHKYRPDSVKKFKCHKEQAERFRQWVLDFMSHSKAGPPSHSDNEDSSSASDFSEDFQEIKKCALISGPPGVGKTSLVYTVAGELNLHVIESHSSEKRDFKLFNKLKLANQKGKINPIAKLFQATQQQQQQKQPHKSKTSKRKRRKLSESDHDNEPQCLSLSGGASIVLFDDIDVIFEDDGPFLKSLVDFIRESKRPVVLTATQSIELLKDKLDYFEHVHLQKPMIEDCIQLLTDVCKREKFHKTSRPQNCQTIANKFDCDLRKCLNRIHFYGDQAGDDIDSSMNNIDSILPQLTRLNLNVDENKSVDDEKNDDEADDDVRWDTILDCYRTSCLIDLVGSKFNYIDRSTLLQCWLDGKPSLRNEERNLIYDLGEQIRNSIIELSHSLCPEEFIRADDLLKSIEQQIVVPRDDLLFDQINPETRSIRRYPMRSRVAGSQRNC